MNKIYTLFFLLILFTSKSESQCVITCNQNVGVFSNNDPNTIGYDNMTSSFHSSIASEEFGYRVWGERMLNNGTGHALSPIYINSTNYPALTGTVYFAGVGSNSINNVQMIVLTSTGLFASGTPGIVLSTTIKGTAPFQKVTVNGKTDGLPSGITTDSVKMMFVTYQTIIITTCGGRVFVLSQITNVRGDLALGLSTKWSQVVMSNGQPLTGIVATRGNTGFAFALKNDNTLWTWGNSIQLGNGTIPFNSSAAVSMTLPTGVSKIKMIQATSSNGPASFYVLDSLNKVFALGKNNVGQLADNTSVDRNVWVNCVYSTGALVNNAKWITANEHDPLFPNIGIINSISQMRTAGHNGSFMIARTTNTGFNNLNFPTGINSTDTILFCEVGGHTSAYIKKNTPRYGYVGHHVNGSIGNNDASNNLLTSVNFIIPPIISICGTVCDTPIISKKPFNCNDSIATFIIKGRRNNIVRFNINGVNDSIIIGNNDTAIISRVKPNSDLALNITQVNSVYCNLSLQIKDTLKLNTSKDSFLTICSNKSVIFKQQTINTSGIYRDTLTNVFGCDSFFTLFLTVNNSSTKDSFLTICQPNSVIFNGNTINTSGIFKDTFINSLGCDSILTLNLTVNPIVSTTINQSICSGQSFLGKTISGTYIDTFKNGSSKGCDSIRTLILTVNSKTFSTINQSICQGNSFLGKTISGTYIDTLIGANAKGCDSILTLNLTVNPKTFGSFNQTICEGNSFLFNGINRTVSGAYLDTIVNAKGCDSILTLNLTVNPKTFGSFSQTICEGSSFLFNGINRTISGAYLDTIVNTKGCDSILTLNLTVNPKTFGSFSQTICQGNSFLFNGINRTVSGAYLDTLVNAKGCDSILTLNLTVNPKTFGSFSQTICEGSSFLFNGINRTISGSYLDTLVNAKGCDSILTLNLTVNPKTFGSFSQTICEGSSFLFNGINRTISGSYLDTLINVKGCDSILTLNLTVNPKTFGSFSQTICEGNSFLFNGINRTISGAYLDTIVNAKGCDSILTLNLTVNPKTFGSFSQTICEGSSFLFNGVNRTVSGAYLDTLINAKGCDSILTLNLTVNPKTFGTINQTICQGSSFLFNGVNRTVSGAYLDTLVNAKGCDSILTLNLTVNPKTFGTINQTICQGSSFLFNGVNRSVSGAYLDTLVNAKGCDSILTLNLTVNPKTFGSFSLTICEGSSFLGRTTSGTYIDTLLGANAKGCDSIRTLILKVNPKTFGTINQTICQGNSFLFNGINRTVSGAYLDTLVNAKGCDSILTLNLTVNPKKFGSFSQTICEGSSFLFNGISRTISGAYLDTLVNAKGCDSILTLNLTVNPKTFGSFNQTICEGNSFLFNGINRTVSGAYLDTIVNAKGCDSILTLNLTVNPITISTIYQSICLGDTFMGRTISGIYTDTIKNGNSKGCDSIRTLNLTVNATNKPGISIIPNPNCSNKITTISAITPSGSYIYNWTVPNGQSSPGNVASFTTNIAGIYRLNIKTKTSILCNTDFENNQVISGANFLITNQNNVPCWKTTASDQMIEVWSNGFSGVPSYSGNQFVELNANMVSTLFQNFIAKSGNQIEISFAHRGRSGTDVMSVEIGKIGGPYINLGNFSAGNTAWVFNSLIYTIPNTISDTNFTLRFNSVSAAGGATIGNFLDAIDIKIISCKSDDTSVQLIINPLSSSTLNQTICEGSSFLGRTTSGTYIDTLFGANAKGCDSIRTLILTVNPKTFGTINQTICEGSSFLFNGVNRTISGAYLDTLVNIKGCDSILTLNLTVNPKTFGTINQTICQGNSLLFNGINRTISGTYLDTLVNAKGCDSILTLNLTVNPKTTSTINQTICEGSSFLGRTTSGTYTDTLVGANSKGCDSIRTLNLTVNPITFGSINQTICQGISFLFNGINRTASGAYLDTLVNAKGCDSILTLNLIVNPKTFGSYSQTICEGSSFLFNGINRTVSGAFLDTLVNAKGCDSILTLNLTVNPKTFGSFNQTICEGSSFLFNGINRTVSGAYLDTLVNAKGCDSILTLNLTVNPKTFGTINQTICQGNSFLFNGINRTISGSYLDTLVNAKGCDSILALNLTVNPKTTSTINQTICEGSSFLGRTTSGTYTDTLIGANAKGCDSIRTLILTVNPKTFGTINQTICQGSSFLGRTTSGTYTDTLVGANSKGCDSIRTLNLIVNPKTFSTINQTICEGSSFLGRNISGTYIDTLIGANAKGCDSIRTLNMIVNPTTFGSFSHNICEGNSFLFNGINRTVSGAYLDTLVNAKGCDSILTLNLTVNSKTFDTIKRTICEGDSFLFNGIKRTISGLYNDTLVNSKGCDSILTLNLKVNLTTFSTINQTICQGQIFLARMSSGTFSDTFVGSNGCDSIRTLVLTVIPKTYSNFKETICEGESFFNRTKTGIYHDTLVNANGCDSIRTLNLTVNPTSRTIINKTICFGDEFLGKSTTGKHLDTFTNQYGCDSIREINLIVISPIRTQLNYEICEGEIFRGHTKTGIYLDTFKNILGCDSIIETLDLFVRPNIDSSFKIRICEGTSFRGKTTAGNYVDSFQNNFGCKSIYRYELSLNPKTYSFETKSICFNQKYKGYSKTGIYKVTLTNQYGCDSIVTLTLTVKSDFITKKLKDTTINEGDTILLQAQKGFLLYTWNTMETTSEILVHEKGNYKVTIMNHDGCVGYDSCNINIIPKDTSGVDTTVIDSFDGYAECPNVFTPNDDFKNDLFKPDFYGRVEVVRLLVYTRLGEKVYEGHGNFSAWDGIYKGEKCEPGVYVYFIEYNNNKGKHFAKGSVTLIR